MSAALEWARLDAATVVVASAQRAWVHQARASDVFDPFASEMTAPGAIDTTRRLLDGAIGVGLRRAKRAGGAPPALTVARWIGRLVSYFHLTTHTPSLMRTAAARFRVAGRAALARWAEEKAEDEDRHDRLAIKDLSDLGIDPAIVHAWTPPTAAAMVARFRESVSHDVPLDCVAYAHTVERLAAAQGQATIDRVRAVLPPGSHAWRSLRVHSGIGSDAAHVDENVALIAGLAAAERTRIALACCEITEILSAPPTSGVLDEASLEQIIAPWRLTRSDPCLKPQ